MKKELITFEFVVKANFNKYSGTRFNETHLVAENPTEFMNKNLGKYLNDDFKLINITTH